MKKIIALILALSVLTVVGTSCKDRTDPTSKDKAAVGVNVDNDPDDDWMADVDMSNFTLEDFNIPLQVGKEISGNDIMKLIFPEEAEAAGVVTSTTAKAVTTTKKQPTTAVQTVTDSSGQAVTDTAGSAVTEVVTEVTTAGGTVAKDPVMEELKSFWINMSRSSDYVFEGKMISLTFRVKDDAVPGGVSPIEISKTDFCNYGDDSTGGMPQGLYPSVINGSVTVGSSPKSSGSTSSGFTVYVDNAAAQPGENVTVNINVANNPGFVAFLLHFKYDTSLLEYVESTEGSDFKNAM